MEPRNKDVCHEKDKLGLFVLAGMIMLVIGGIVFGLFHNNGLPDGADGLLGTIIAGLLLFARDLVSAIRAGWEEVTRGKVNEQLAKAAPVLEDKAAPQSASDAAEQVAHKAQAEADRIAGQTER